AGLDLEPAAGTGGSVPARNALHRAACAAVWDRAPVGGPGAGGHLHGCAGGAPQRAAYRLSPAAPGASRAAGGVRRSAGARALRRRARRLALRLSTLCFGLVLGDLTPRPAPVSRRTAVRAAGHTGTLGEASPLERRGPPAAALSRGAPSGH